MSPSLRAGVLLVAVLAAAPGLRAQGAEGPATRPLTLEEAVEAAVAGNAGLAVAEARRELAVAGERRAEGALWPGLDLRAGGVRSNDPVAAFGTKLRQGRFQAADLDLEALNHPDPVTDWNVAFQARWSVLDPTAWAGSTAARRRARAAGWATERTREATVMQTRALYYRAQGASAQLTAAEAAVEAARATRDLFARRRDRGLLTEADYLQAEAELAAAEAARLEAERRRLDALQALGRHLGWDPDTLPEPTDELAEPGSVEEEGFEPAARADIRALEQAAAAAAAAQRRARLQWLPAVDLFAEYGWHSGTVLGFQQDNWTVGAMLRWTVFNRSGRGPAWQEASLQRRIATIQLEEAARDALQD